MPSTPRTVLLLGATGRTGRRVLAQLLGRGVSVRAIVRSRTGLPPELSGHPALTVSEASLLSLSDAELREHLRGCDAVVSCLGHNLSGRTSSSRRSDATARPCKRAIVRPDSLLEGEITEYALHEGLVDRLFAPGSTNMRTSRT